MITIATWFTLLRIFLVPGIVAAMLTERWMVASITFIVAAITDMLDGAIARWYKVQTALGACLDAIADKILLLSSFGSLAWVHAALIPSWFVWLMVAKEILLVAGALVVGLEKGWECIRPTKLGKMLTCAQIFFIGWFFICHFFGWQPIKTWYGVLYLLTGGILTVLLQYAILGFKVYSPNLKKKHEKNL